MTDLSLWGRIRGHDEIVERLQRVIDKGQPAHAYLFYGPRGVGKAKTALAFAAALGCPRACGVCPSCRAVLGGTHGDFHYIEPDGRQIRREQITELLRTINLKRRSDYKVIIIDDAHSLGQEAANALLKTLEEPPPGVVFILVASNAGRILTTITSRCRRVVFGALGEEAVRDILLLEGVARDDAAVAAKLARGMVGEALEIATGGLLEKRTHLIRALVAGEPDAGKCVEAAVDIVSMAKARASAAKKAQDARLDEMLELIAKRDQAAFTKRVAAANKRELAGLEARFYRQALLVVGSIYRDLLLMGQGVDTDFAANSDLRSEFKGRTLSSRQARAALEQIDLAAKRLRHNVGALLTFENLFFALEACA